MSYDLYNTRLLDLVANIPKVGRLTAPHASHYARSMLCGSEITVDLCLEGDRISAYAHEVKACALGQAAASIVARHIEGTSISEFREISARMRKMLHEAGPSPAGKWSDLSILSQVAHYPARQPSTLLVFDAIEGAIAKATSGQGSSVDTPTGAQGSSVDEK